MLFLLSECITRSKGCLGALVLKHEGVLDLQLPLVACSSKNVPYNFIVGSAKPLLQFGHLFIFGDVLVQILTVAKTLLVLNFGRENDWYNTEFKNKHNFGDNGMLCPYFDCVCCFGLNKLTATHIVY